MKTLSLALMVSFGLITSAIAAPSPVYSWKYEARVPAGATSCDATAQDLALRIKQSSDKITRADGRCIARATFQENHETFTVDTLEVTYEAPLSIPLYSVKLPTDEMAGLDTTYPTYRSCFSDLNNQGAIFQQATGLRPLTATCVPGASRYSLRIDGIGQPLKKLRTFKNSSPTSMVQNAEWRQAVLDILSQVGGVISVSGGDTLAYYAADDKAISARSLFNSNTLEQCESQIAEVRTLLQKLGSKNNVVVCQADPLSHFLMNAATDLSPFYGYYERAYRGMTFYTFEECMAVRADILNRDPMAARWAGSFCAPQITDPSHFELKIFTRD